LKSDWEGHQKEMFISAVNPPQQKTATLLEYLRRQEQIFRTLRVTRQEEYSNPAWEAYMGKK
jgi:hypothetical protein